MRGHLLMRRLYQLQVFLELKETAEEGDEAGKQSKGALTSEELTKTFRSKAELLSPCFRQTHGLGTIRGRAKGK